MMNKLYFLLILFFTAFYSVKAQNNYNALIHKGNKAYNSKDYEAAGSKFLDAAKLKSKDFAAHYNLGNSFYKRKMYKEALAEYNKAQALAKTKSDRMAALYNMGNANMQEKNHEKAAEYYKKALKQDPYNDAARKNFEIAMLKDKQKKQKESKGGGGNKGKNPQEPKDNNGKSPQSGGQDKQQQGSGEGNDPNKSENSNLPKDLERQILKNAEDKERETARRILNKNGYSVPQSNEKDW